MASYLEVGTRAGRRGSALVRPIADGRRGRSGASGELR